MKKLIFCIILVLTLVFSLAGCNLKDLTGGSSTTEPVTATTEPQVELPDDFKNMNEVILATLVGMEKTEIDYETVKNEVSWDLLIYLLKSDAKLSNATNDYGSDKMIIPDAYTKEFAAAMFASYNGISSLPELPDSFESSLVQYDSDTGSYIIKKEELGKREIKTVSTTADGDSGYNVTVDYIDTDKNTAIASYKIVLQPSVYKTGKPIFNYSIVSINKVI